MGCSPSKKTLLKKAELADIKTKVESAAYTPSEHGLVWPELKLNVVDLDLNISPLKDKDGKRKAWPQTSDWELIDPSSRTVKLKTLYNAMGVRLHAAAKASVEGRYCGPLEFFDPSSSALIALLGRRVASDRVKNPDKTYPGITLWWPLWGARPAVKDQPSGTTHNSIPLYLWGVLKYDSQQSMLTSDGSRSGPARLFYEEVAPDGTSASGAASLAILERDEAYIPSVCTYHVVRGNDGEAPVATIEDKHRVKMAMTVDPIVFVAMYFAKIGADEFDGKDFVYEPPAS